MKRFFKIFFFPMFCCTLFGGVIADDCVPGYGVSNNTCKICPKGFYGIGGSNSCEQCAKGSYAPTAGLAACIPCPVGTHASILGAKNCTKCTAGTYSDTSGAENCQACPMGRYSLEGSKSCRPCPKGTYADADGSASCTPCPAGTFSDTIEAQSASSCQACPELTYAEEGSASCETCPAGHCCVHGISYACIKGTWSPGNESCQSAQGYMTTTCNNSRGTNNGDTGGTGGNVVNGDGGSCYSQTTYKKGACLNTCAGPCTTPSVGAASEDYCTVKTIKTFNYNGSKTFEWPSDGSVSEKSIKSSSGVNFSISRCPAS